MNWIHDNRNAIWTWNSPVGLYVVSEWEDAVFFPDGTSQHDIIELNTDEMKVLCERHFAKSTSQPVDHGV